MANARAGGSLFGTFFSIGGDSGVPRTSDPPGDSGVPRTSDPPVPFAVIQIFRGDS